MRPATNNSWAALLLAAHLAAIAWFAFSVISWSWISVRFDYDWWRLFYHSLIESQVDIEAFAEPFSPALYLDALRAAAVQLFAGGAMVATALPLFLLLWLIAWSGNWRGNLNGILRPSGPVSLADVSLLCIMVFGAFLVLFPLISRLDRFLTPYYAIITLYAVARSCGAGAAGNQRT